jgi:hypothetical protein
MLITYNTDSPQLTEVQVTQFHTYAIFKKIEITTLLKHVPYFSLWE